MNKAVIIGRLTKDPDVRYTNSGMAIARFNLAVDRKTKEKATDFIPCIAFSKTAEIMEKYVSKGNKIGIAGHIQTGSYEKDGRMIYTVDIVVDELEFLEKRETSNNSKHEETSNNPKHEETNDIPDGFEELKDEDLPF